MERRLGNLALQAVHPGGLLYAVVWCNTRQEGMVMTLWELYAFELDKQYRLRGIEANDSGVTISGYGVPDVTFAQVTDAA